MVVNESLELWLDCVITHFMQFILWWMQLAFDRLTMTSLRSLVCRWWRGSRKFCLMLSSSEYLTSAICFNASPISIRAIAVNISSQQLSHCYSTLLNPMNVSPITNFKIHPQSISSGNQQPHPRNSLFCYTRDQAKGDFLEILRANETVQNQVTWG